MDEMMRRYLRQQLEIGGKDVVVGARGVGRSVGQRPQVAPEAPAAEPQVAATPPAPRAEAARPVSRPAPAERPPSAKDWRVGAPEIPGPGLTIPRELLGEQAARWADLGAVASAVAACRTCFLAQGRTNVVPGEGDPTARLVLVGEGPGQTEDETGRPFVGRAGELLTGILAAIGLARDQVFICNVVKCRPPQNRKPLPDEMAACSPFLRAQLDLIAPKVIVALGATAAEALLGVKRSLADLRLKVHSYRGTPLVVTYHPAALLRNPHWKKPTWDDVRIARQLLDR